MIPCLNQVTTLGTPFEADIPAYSRAGWRAVELWITKLEAYLTAHSIAEARGLLDGEGVDPVAASFQGGLLVSTGAERGAHWDHFRRRLEWLQALGVPTLVVAPDFLTEPTGDDLGRAARSLAEAAEAAAAHNIRLALEFQKNARFGASIDSALALVVHSGASVALCLDVFHYYTGPSKFEDLAYLGRESVGLVQLCDLSGTPRELARDADRIFPGDGDFQLGPILDHLVRIGYAGPVSLEVANPAFWEMPADRVAGIGLAALERALGDRAAPPPPREPGGA